DVAVFFAATAGGIKRFIDGKDNVGHRDGARQPGQRVPASGPANAVDQSMTAQLAEQLLEIGKRNILPLTNCRKRHRPALLTQCEIDHRSDGKTALGGQTHDGSLQYFNTWVRERIWIHIAIPDQLSQV